MLSQKSNNVKHTLLEEKDSYDYDVVYRTDDPVGTLPVGSIEARRAKGSNICWIHCGQYLKKSLTAGQKVWLMSLWGKFKPCYNIYWWPVKDGYVAIICNDDNTQANVSFIPNRDMKVNEGLFLDVVYMGSPA